MHRGGVVILFRLFNQSKEGLVLSDELQ